MQPPLLFTADGVGVDLFRVPKGLLRKLAETAWAQLITRQHRHRHTMTDLQGLNLDVIRCGLKRLTFTEQARLHALQSGARISNAQHSKYDTGKSATCSCCGVLDTVEHKIRFCRLYEACRHGHEEVLSRWDALPVCLTHHLLPPANPHLRALYHEIDMIRHPLPEKVGHWELSSWHDLFTDGTRLFDMFGPNPTNREAL